VLPHFTAVLAPVAAPMELAGVGLAAVGAG
jgi:hypothetical protein